MEEDQLYCIIDWDDGYSNDIKLTNVEIPKKEVTEYSVGEYVEATLKGFPGNHKGTIVAIDSKFWFWT